MRDRELTLAAVVGVAVCCGTTVLVAGVAGGVALAAVGQLSAVTLAGLGIVVVVARLDRHPHGRGADDVDRSGRVVEKPTR
jgi:hypothetical protein